MAEIPKTGPERTKRDMKLNAGQTVAGTVSGGAFGGLIAHLVGNEANQLGVAAEAGIAVGALGGGANAALRAYEQAREYAFEQNRRGAVVKTSELVAELVAGFAVPVGVLGNEIVQVGMTRGAIAGALTGLAIGGLAANDIRRNFREGRHTIDFSKLHIKPVKGYPEKFRLTEIPPVFRAESFQAMQDFRDSEKEYVLKKHRDKLDKVSDKPKEFGAREISGLFFIPETSHFPAFDPKERKVLGGRLTEKDQAMTLRGADGTTLRAEPPQNIENFWPYTSSFRSGRGGFSWDAWEYFRNESWKNSVLVLAQYRSVGGLMGTVRSVDDIADQYWLVNLYDEEGEMRNRKNGGDKEDKKESELGFVPTPVFAPAPHVQRMAENENIG